MAETASISDEPRLFTDDLVASKSGMRRDGDALAVDGAPGTLLTVPLSFSGDHLLIRADLDDAGDLKVELADDHGEALEGFEIERALVTRSYEDWYDVHWAIEPLRGKMLIMNNVGRPAALRLTLAAGRLHALRIVDTIRPAQVATGSVPMPLSNHPQLFLDDHVVGRMLNLQRDIRQAERHAANPLMSSEHPWEMWYMQPTSVVYDPDGDRFQTWYAAKPSVDSDNPKFVDCYAESADGLTWTKPMIGTAPIGPWKTHNALSHVKRARSVFLDPDDPDPERRYKGVFGATSPDGLQWSVDEEAGANWHAAVGKNDTVTSFVRWKGEYLNYTRYQGPETNAIVYDPRTGKSWKNAVYRATGLATSRDFRHWEPKRMIFVADERDGYPWAQPHALCVTAYGDVLIGLLPMMRMVPEHGNNFLGSFEVQLMVSRDGRDWQRVADRAVFMPRQPNAPIGARDWDYSFHPTANFIVHDDLVRIYYKGLSYCHGENRKNHVGIGDLASTRHHRVEHMHNGLGLATVPADRFVALHPASYTLEGVLDTRLLDGPGENLLVNADLAHGTMQVEVLDADGHVLPGFARAASRLSIRDPLRYEVAWDQGDGRAKALRDVPRDRPYALRFVLINCDMYSFQVESEG
ncbi:MAG: hypothetical protein CMJ18_00585 [Phycisphaeraceae bacterium]|nr:hypothetical protein [Phycisphaeraceae bacterium]